MEKYTRRSKGGYTTDVQSRLDWQFNNITIAEAREWVDRLIAEHGEGARLTVIGETPDGDEVDLEYRISRDATPEEVSECERRTLEVAEAVKVSELRDLARLKAKYEPGL